MIRLETSIPYKFWILYKYKKKKVGKVIRNVPVNTVSIVKESKGKFSTSDRKNQVRLFKTKEKAVSYAKKII